MTDTQVLIEQKAIGKDLKAAIRQSAIISLAHVMEFEVVAEGVEENEQLEILQSIDCDYIQGFIWGRPLDLKDVENLI